MPEEPAATKNGEEDALEAAQEEAGGAQDGAGTEKEQGPQQAARSRQRDGEAEQRVEQESDLRPAVEAAEDEAAEAAGDEAVEGAADDAAEQAAQPAEDVAAEERPRDELKRALESLIFVAERAVTTVQLGRIVKLRSAEVRELLNELMDDYRGRGIELCEVGGGFQFRSAPSSAPYVRVLVSQRPVRLTRAQLETLALVAYRQPITRPEIDEVRGVDTGSAVRVLLERGLIKMLGRKDEPGRPLLYGTSPYFLEFFGMNSLKDLPTLREFTELSEENRELFRRRTGDNVEDVEAELGAASDVDEVSDQEVPEQERAGADGSEPEPEQDEPEQDEPEQEQDEEDRAAAQTESRPEAEDARQSDEAEGPHV